jgi:hypothetical protein
MEPQTATQLSTTFEARWWRELWMICGKLAQAVENIAWVNEEAISSAVAESAVSQIISKRFVKKQQMCWTRQSAHLLSQIRTQVANETLRTTFQRGYPGTRETPVVAEEHMAA